MQETKKVEGDFKKHFAKIQEKIQNKYDEMQKKLEKSKSVDAIMTLSEDYEYKDKNCTVSDLRESDNSSKHFIKQTAILEEIPFINASYHEMQRESSISELVEDFMTIEKDEIEDDYNFFGKDFTQSLESLNEGGDSDGSLAPSTPLPKLSIRNRISLKLTAAKEKRQKKENVAKDKKERAREKVEKVEKVEKFILSNSTKQDLLKNNKRSKMATVTIALIEASGLETDVSEDKPRFLFCRFRLGGEKYKSKLTKSHAAIVKWQELFNLNMYDEHMLEMSLWDKDTFIGRSIVDLTEMEREKTHKMRINLECDVGKADLFILLTITGTSLENTLVDLDDYNNTQRHLSTLKKKFAWYDIKKKSGDVGWLFIIVYGAKGLIGNECYCILELGNERLQTHTDFKTGDPNWMKMFTFTVHDITSTLEVIVHDEKKSEDVGRVSIPLLHIKNSEKKWYALKDPAQRDRAKGNNPRILLEMRVTWDLLRSSLRVIKPKEENFLKIEDKLQRHIFARNLSRAKAVFAWIINAFRVIKNLFEWESRKLNLIALILWLLFCYFFKMWMLPLLLLVPFVWYRPPEYFLIYWKKYFKTQAAVEIYEDSKKQEEKSSLRQKINSFQEMLQSVQNFLGAFASLGESIKNLFNFTVPFLSCLAIVCISMVALIMYLIPLKYILMIWGIHKFSKKMLQPNRIPNNEILDLLSRVPDDEALLNVQELPLEDVPEEDVIK